MKKNKNAIDAIEQLMNLCHTGCMSVNINKEKTKKTIGIILGKVKSEADPLLLAEYHDLFKKEVSLFQRTKVAAYLLMLCDQGKNLRYALKDKNVYRRNETESRSSGASADEHPDTQRFLLTDEDSKRLFFSVGRSRRVFPREIIGLINTKTAIPREDIGAIRILDNYSFVQVRDTVAEQIIETLNGISFRGRPLVVNYAKSRNDEETVNGEAAASEQGQDHSEEEDI